MVFGCCGWDVGVTYIQKDIFFVVSTLSFASAPLRIRIFSSSLSQPLQSCSSTSAQRDPSTRTGFANRLIRRVIGCVSASQYHACSIQGCCLDSLYHVVLILFGFSQMAVECCLRQKARLSFTILVTDAYDLFCNGAGGRARWSWVHSVMERDVTVPGVQQ